MEETADGHRIVVQPRFKDEEAFQSGRASFPRRVYVELLLPRAAPEIHLTLTWLGKPATRLPEAMWLTFNPSDRGREGLDAGQVKRDGVAV